MGSVGCGHYCRAAGATHQLGWLDHELEGHDAAALGVLIVAAVLQADQIIVTTSGWQLYACLLTTYANSKQKCPSRERHVREDRRQMDDGAALNTPPLDRLQNQKLRIMG